MKFDYEFKNFIWLLLILVIGLNVCGIFVVSSASNQNVSVVNRQIIGSLAGLIICLAIAFLIDYNKLVKIGFLIYLGTVAILGAVLVMGIATNGAGRWIVLPVIGQIQPAEFAKIGIIITFARFFESVGGSKNSLENTQNNSSWKDVNKFRNILKAIIIFAIPALLIFLEPNLSTTIIFFVIFIMMYYAAGLSYLIILPALGVSAVLLFGFIYTFTTEDLYKKIPFIKEYQKDRILGFLNPELNPDTFTQQKNSITAIASGKILGKGLYNTEIGSVKTGNFLIEGETDFIFAIIGEELGFRGALIILIAFAVVIALILRIGATAKNKAGCVICAGYATWIGFQTFTNIAVATAIFPNTGVTLPFFSRGVSSLIALYIGLGIVLNISLQRKKQR